jgi:hypothetical protein
MPENLFSRRKGYALAPVQGNREELSLPARTRLWNILFDDIFLPNFESGTGFRSDGSMSPHAEELLKIIWTEIFRNPVDEYPGFRDVLEAIKSEFLKGKWYFPFDVFELVLRVENYLLPGGRSVAPDVKAALERENTAYTLLDGLFAERMTPQEVQAVEEALQSPIEGIRIHFSDALQKLSDRESPDFRNSVKESISAVEAACKYLSKRESATLPDALKMLETQRAFHPAFKEALIRLYGWTSDEGGIRHAIKDTDKVERADAQFMLVACSAFVNYLLTR